MHELRSFDYAIIRVVPSIERGEAVNVGAILFSREANYLGGCIEPDWDRILALWPRIDRDELGKQLHHFENVIRGDPHGGPIAQLSPSQRFHWLTGPRSTVIQVSEPHAGLCADPPSMLEHLMETAVRV